MRIILCLSFIPLLMHAQPNVVPNPASRGSLGQATNKWTAVYADAYYGTLMSMHEAYYSSNTTATANPGSGTWHRLTNTTWQTGEVAMPGWDVITNAMVYTNADPSHVHGAATVSFSQGTPVGDTSLAFALDGSILYNSQTERKIGGAGDVGSTALHPMFLVTNGQALTLWGKSAAAGDITVRHFNCVVISMFE